MARRFTIAVEGNIASGKSTLLAHLQQSEQAQVVVEPVAAWQSVFPGSDGNLIERMYNDPQRWAYLFQSYVLLTMMEAHDEPQTRPLKVMERSIYSARYCFIENLRKSDPPLIDEMEYQVYQRWFDYLMEHKRPHLDLIVYLRTDPEVCFQRLKQRGRHEESGVPLSYLQSLHRRYEEWLIHNPTQHGGDVPILVLDGNQDFQIDEQLHEQFSQQIQHHIHNNSVVPVVATPMSPDFLPMERDSSPPPEKSSAAGRRLRLDVIES